MMNNFSTYGLEIIEQYIGNYDYKYHIRELERLLNIDIKILSRELNKLVLLNIIDFEIKGRLKQFFLKKNINSYLYLCMAEKYHSMKFIKKNKMLIPFLNELLLISDFIIFGSYAKGEVLKESDIDLIVFTKDKKKLKELSKSYNIKCHFQFTNTTNFLNSIRNKNPLALEVLKNHIIFGDSSFLNKVICFE